MKLGVISDVHGDPAALELAWARLMMLGADRIVCAGDVAGYGPDPDGAAAFLVKRQIATVRGNHDRWALERPAGEPDAFGSGLPGAATLEFLAVLPPYLILREADRVVLVTHGSPGNDMDFVTPRTHPPSVLESLLEATGADVMIVGHTHKPMWFRCARGLVVNPGSLIAAPVVRSSRSFALIDLADVTVTFHEVESGRSIRVPPWAGAPDEGPNR